jgi:Electron transfer DM13
MNIKKTAIALLASTTLGFAVFSVNNVVNAQTVQTAATVETVLNFAKFEAIHAPTEGTVVIVQKTDGSTVLRIQNLKTEPGPDLHVYLSAGAVPTPAKDGAAVKTGAKYLDLGKIPAPFKGFYEFVIPAKTDLAQFKSALIWCDLASVTFAGAKLN